MAKYSKFFVALVGLVILGLKEFVGIDAIGQTDTIVNLVIMGLTAAGVWTVPNAT